MRNCQRKRIYLYVELECYKTLQINESKGLNIVCLAWQFTQEKAIRRQEKIIQKEEKI